VNEPAECAAASFAVDPNKERANRVKRARVAADGREGIITEMPSERYAVGNR
jgi:hypothetical protein